MTKTVAGIMYNKPQVILLQETGIGTSETAARTCYDSFSNSENNALQILNADFTALTEEPGAMDGIRDKINDTEHSDLLDSLAWTYFHHSIMEHANLTYIIRGTSRGVLQEHSRHRIQAISVRSTRYTMSNVLNAYIASINVLGNSKEDLSLKTFIDFLETLDMFVLRGDLLYAEIAGIKAKLDVQRNILGNDEFYKLAVAKSSLHYITEIKDPEILFTKLQEGKKKRNVGDSFKHIVTDNWKVDMVVTFNLRSLKNYFQLRDSGAAYFQIQWLAQAMKKVTPSKYLDLIIKAK